MTTQSLRKIQEEMKTFILENKKGKFVQLSDHEYGRISIYRDLIHNMMTNFFADVFPLSYKLLKGQWRKLISEYYAKYTPDDPILVYLAEKFPLFIKEKNLKPDYLAELACYEWSELEVSIYKAEKKSRGITPAHLVIDFEYPITEIAHEIEKDHLDFMPEKKHEQILFYRDEQSLLVKTFKLAPTTAIALESLDQGETLDQIAIKIKNLFKLGDKLDSKIKSDLEALVLSLQEKGILLQ